MERRNLLKLPLAAAALSLAAGVALAGRVSDGLGRGSLDSHVKSLRAKVGSHRIRTVHGVGYALDDGIDR